MKRFWMAALLACTAIAAVAAQQGTRPATTAAAQFEAATKKEMVDGDLAAAIQLYRKLAEGSDRAVAAKALMRMGQCYEKLGTAQAAESRKAYERLVRDFADQREVAEQARARLAALAPNAAPAPPSPPGSLRRLYQAPGLPAGQVGINLSADARYVIVSPRAGNEFTVRELSTGKEVHVPHPSAEALAAEWHRTSPGQVNGIIMSVELSPDGTQLAYAVWVGAPNLASDRPMQIQIRVVNTDGSGGRLVTRQDGTWMDALRWTADGRSVVTTFATPAARTFAVVSIRVSDGSVTKLSAPIPASDDDLTSGYVSPDGRFVAIWEELDTGDVVSIADTRTGKRSRIGEPVKSNVFRLVGWAPDGSGLVLITDRSGSPGAWLLRLVDGVPQGAPELLRANIEAGNSPRLGPDGSYYYMKNSQVARRYLTALDPATGKVRGQPTLIPELENVCGYDWSPDGTAIAYGVRLNKGAGSEKAPCTLVAIRTVEDGRERIVSPSMSEIRRPRWSPDGKSLVVFGQKDGVFGVFKLDPETNSARLLVESPLNQRTGDRIPSAEWAPNGKGLFLGRLDSDADGRVLDYRLVHRDLESGLETDLYSIKPPAMFWFTTTRVSRDGSLCLLVNEADGSRAAVLVPSGGGSARTVYRVPASSAFPGVAWAADGKSIYVAPRTPGVGEPNTRKLLRVPIDGAEPVDAGLTLVGLDEGLPSPDGKRQFFGVLENVAEIWAIDRLVPAKAAAPAAPRK
jgi:Tol biopolymer transport system component